MRGIPVGVALQPDPVFLELMEGAVGAAVDYVEIAPETTWWSRPDGALATNRYGERFADLIDRLGVFAVAHGVGLSMATASGDDAPRQRAWLDRMRADQERFRYRWYSDHLGASSLGGQCVMLPMPVPMTAASVRLVRRQLAAMREVTGAAGVENSAFYYAYGEPLAEADFLAAIVGDEFHLVLDLHNLYTLSVNTGVAPAAYLDRLPLDRVIELHISGGSASDPSWLGGDVMRLDSHDTAVPEPVWSLLAEALPRCTGVRGITLERMEGTVTAAGGDALAAELHRARAVAAATGRDDATARAAASSRVLQRQVADRQAAGERAGATEHALDADGYRRFEDGVVRAMMAREPAQVIAALGDDATLPDELRRAASHAAADARGVKLTALLVARLRFERLMQGSMDASDWFERDPATFAAAFRAYHAAVPPRAFFPAAEAATWNDWLASRTP